MATLPSTSPKAPTQPCATNLPLRKCFLRCDRYLQLLVGGTYGYVRADGSGKPRTKFHGGVDLFAEQNTPCFAVAPGVVEWILPKDATDWGNAVLIRHKGNWFSLYAHLAETYVKKDSPIQKAHLIGLTGISGNGDAAYPHLHFEIWKSLTAGKKGTREKYRIDPLNVLGPLPFVPFAADVIDRNQRRATTA
ncbi:M23 family metallopeptidase [Variovorax sp. JS1663]|uniref:M23 family metallopeptidase n=1 Tax=Variovorax sp. JS1663 TaxID=1851577 RepID=UPI000B66C75B|nr:M23 family metallopeptidase [Variovorax sp. JS1663]OUL99196.1 hypothetical protein A8M77_27740 [Variovorax sp. JS1663]